ncbi:Two-component signal transduction system YycFG, regulatory protein YycH [Aerococcus urinaehominis]|nr:Two-component signal transduction system YycFG, regulatory protein YycH [Aerococcus urinaehominis]
MVGNQSRPLAQIAGSDNQEDLQLAKTFGVRKVIRHQENGQYGQSIDTKLTQLMNDYLIQLGKQKLEVTKSPLADNYYEKFSGQAYAILAFADEIPLSFFISQTPDSDFSGQERVSQVIITAEDNQVYLLNEKAQEMIIVSSSDQKESISKLAKNLADYPFTPVIPVNLDGRYLFLTNQDVRLDRLTYMIERQANVNYLSQLFAAPSEVHDYSDEIYTRYYGDEGKLMINTQTYSLLFERHGDLVEPTDYEATLVNSLAQLSKFQHNIDNWYFTSYDEANHQVRYRYFVNNIPIFGQDYTAKAELVMSANDLQALRMSTINIQTPLTDRSKSLVLPSGQEVYQGLVAAGIDQNDIQDMVPGYYWIYSQESARLVELVPTWFIRLGGNWQLLSNLVDLNQQKNLATKDQEGQVFDFNRHINPQGQDSQDSNSFQALDEDMTINGFEN